jgi:hypothetical protein
MFIITTLQLEVDMPQKSTIRMDHPFARMDHPAPEWMIQRHEWMIQRPAPLTSQAVALDHPFEWMIHSHE